MPSNPPLVSDLEAEVNERCGLLLAEAGEYLLGPADAGTGLATTPAIREGLRRGCKAVGLTLANGLVLADADAAQLTTHAVERVMDEAELFALARALLMWWRVAQVDQEAVSSSVVASGWRVDQKAAVKARVGELKAICAVPYREPTDPTVVMNRDQCVPGQPLPPGDCNPWGYPYGLGTYGPYGTFGQGGWCP